MGTIVHKAQKEEQYFEYENNGITLQFEYRPTIKKTWDNFADFEFHLLENPYLNKESNIYETYVKFADDERIGWIFPLSVLESDTVEDRGNLLNYIYIAYQELLNRIDNLDKGNLLSDYYAPNSIICIIHKGTINKITGEDFNIQDYIISLYTYGYSLIGQDERANPINNYKYNCDKRIYIRKTKSLCGDDFINQLVQNELPYADNFLYRFMLLYQVVEYLMEKESANGIMNAIGKYNAKNIDKNTLLVEIRDQISEQKLIKDIFKNSNIDNKILSLFQQECEQLFKTVPYIPSSKDSPTLFYNLRNQLVHSYRKYIAHKEQLITTIRYFELIILEIIISY